jgi:hypothetical protein
MKEKFGKEKVSNKRRFEFWDIEQRAVSKI